MILSYPDEWSFEFTYQIQIQFLKLHKLSPNVFFWASDYL